ncbi:probable disease resistance protein RPP1 isoform X1 [Tripterygium wilfordii]|uniref:probable disease resistance protein RPP1 isoform X1 n=1 Tax=Tripterygium wilfordii TaxID=458696 RepID=UPI0018F838EF|nr:probable disease resistance protein RPP1 isoform X1 [Tripterygium wilfordii]
MASSSSIIPITPIQRKYDVFISFRGRHIRDNFLSHLRSALFGEKIVSFAEDNIRRGDDISKSLRRTIKESQISIIIFSKKYPSSRWCLGELEKIMKCNKKNGQFVIPVFLKVKPTDVENQTGCFGQALAQYEGHPKIQIWRAAFTKAANLAGWDSEVTRPQATLNKNIVYDVMSKLYFASPNDFRNVAGVRYHIQQIESSLIMVQQMFNNGLDRISNVPLLNGHAFKPEHPLNGHHMRLSKREINYSFSSFSQMKYDVFLSFRRADTRNNISSHAYAALRREKIQTFIDYDLHRVDVVLDSLFKTITESKIPFVIFSENYVSQPGSRRGPAIKGWKIFSLESPPIDSSAIGH